MLLLFFFTQPNDNKKFMTTDIPYSQSLFLVFFDIERVFLSFMQHFTQNVRGKSRAAFRSASYPDCFCPGPLLLLALVIRYKDPGQNVHYHSALRNAAQIYLKQQRKKERFSIKAIIKPSSRVCTVKFCYYDHSKFRPLHY